MAAGHAMSARRYMARPRRDARADRDGRGEEPRALAAQPLRAVPARRSASRRCWRARLDRRPAGRARLQPDQRRRRRRGRLQPARARSASASPGRARRCAAIGLVSGTLRTGLYDLNEEDISRRAGEQAYALAGIDPATSTSSRCTTASPSPRSCAWKDSGLIPRGEGAPWTADGRTSIGGELPVNPSGGLLSRGHPVGATGMAQVCELYWQLTGQAGARQVDGARLALSLLQGRHRERHRRRLGHHRGGVAMSVPTTRRPCHGATAASRTSPSARPASTAARAR